VRFIASATVAVLMALGSSAAAQQAPPTTSIPQPKALAPQKQPPARQGDQGSGGVPAVPVPKVETVPLNPAQNRPTENERGTKEAPLIVEMTNPPNGDAIAAEMQKNREDQAAENRRFNIFLIAVGILQAVALIYTSWTARKAANAAKAAAVIAERTFQREEALLHLKLHAVMQPGFAFLKELSHTANAGDLRLTSQNRGAAGGTLKGVLIQVADDMPATPPAEGYEVKETSHLLDYREARTFDFLNRVPKNDQYLFGYLRWYDGLGRWRYRFCVRVRPNPPEGFDKFHEWGGNAWNREEQDPNPYT